MIRVEQLSKTFQLTKKQRKEAGLDSSSVLAVNNIDFECKPGRIFSLLGPNGAGKTTTLRMIATIMKPSSGKITVAGHDTVTESADVRKKIGFLTGSTGLYNRLSANEIIKYFADLYGMEQTKFKQRKRSFLVCWV